MRDRTFTATLRYVADVRLYGQAGWYYADNDYPDEAAIGPFFTQAEAVRHAQGANYVVRTEQAPP